MVIITIINNHQQSLYLPSPLYTVPLLCWSHKVVCSIRYVMQTSCGSPA